jgi:hypothetical protein
VPSENGIVTFIEVQIVGADAGLGAEIEKLLRRGR